MPTSTKIKEERPIQTQTEELKAKLYKVSIAMGGEVFEIEAPDLHEAFLAFKPTKLTTKTLITVEYDGKKSENYMFPARARMVFNNKLASFVFARNLSLRLK